MIRQMFWTYAAYILSINLFFGLISVFLTSSLIEGSALAFSVTLFIGLYWAGRIAIQFFYFDRGNFPKGWIYILGELMLVCLFIFLAGVYLYVSYYNYLILKR